MTAEDIPAKSLKVWDRSTLNDALEDEVRELVARTGAQRRHVVTTRTGPDTYTVTLSRHEDTQTSPPHEVPC